MLVTLHWSLIRSFRHKGLEKFFAEGAGRYVEANLRVRVADILAVLNAAKDLSDLEIPGFRLHELQGNRKGTWSITVRANWRITFTFKAGEAKDVDLEDYH